MSAQIIVQMTSGLDTAAPTARLEAKSRGAGDCFELLLRSAVEARSKISENGGEGQQGAPEATDTDNAEAMAQVSYVSSGFLGMSSISASGDEKSVLVVNHSPLSNTSCQLVGAGRISVQEVPHDQPGTWDLYTDVSEKLTTPYGSDVSGQFDTFACVSELTGEPRLTGGANVEVASEIISSRNNASSRPGVAVGLIRDVASEIISFRNNASFQMIEPETEFVTNLSTDTDLLLRSVDKRAPAALVKTALIERGAHAVSEGAPLLENRAVSQIIPDQQLSSERPSNSVPADMMLDQNDLSAVEFSRAPRPIDADAVSVVDPNAGSRDRGGAGGSTGQLGGTFLDDSQIPGTDLVRQFTVVSVEQKSGATDFAQRAPQTQSEDATDAPSLSKRLDRSFELRDAEYRHPSGVPIAQGDALTRHAPETSTSTSLSVSKTDTALVQDVVGQIKTALLNRDGERYEILIKLHPPELGHLTVRIAQDSHGLSSHIEASRQEVHNLLKAHLPLLTDTLLESGIKLSSLTVSHDSPSGAIYHNLNHQWGDPQQGASSNNQSGRRYTGGSHTQGEVLTLDPLPDPDLLQDTSYVSAYSWFA
ncbi:MAG: flagellar hook-length control protein FliK [Armatimonadota bacterium]|nr:flagellar hook-length control protein FliK [Armatimonadota bacterium]